MKPATPKTELPPSSQLRQVVFRGFLYVSFLAGLMIAFLPHRVFAQGVATGYGWCGRAGHPSVKGDCPICVRERRPQNGGGTYPAIQQPSGPSQAEIAAQQAEAERQRQQVETDRLEREAAEQRAVAEAKERERQAEFKITQANAIKSLKGVTPTGSQLKSAGNIQDNSPRGFGLKGIGDTGIKDVKPDHAVRDLGGTDAAWKQLNAAAYLAGLSLKNSSDPVESAYLAEQAARAMNGDPLGVVVPRADPRPGAERSGPAFQTVTKHIMAELKTRTTELAEKKQKVVESNQKKEAAQKETKVAREQVEKLELELKPPQLAAVATTAPPVADKTKSDALAKAKAALLAAQQSEAETTRAEERAVSEAKFSEQKINETLNMSSDLNQNPGNAKFMLDKLQAATAPAPTPAR